jgi:hypothetical protein
MVKTLVLVLKSLWFFKIGLYGRNPNLSARVCNLCENGNIQDEKHVIFHVWAPNVFGTSSTIYLIIFLKVLSRVLFFNITHS